MLAFIAQVTSTDTAIYFVGGLAFIGAVLTPASALYIARSNRRAAEAAAKTAKESADAAADAAANVLAVTKQSAATTVAATKQVAATLADSTSLTVGKLDSIKKVSDGTHVLVNAQHTALLGTVASMARVIAHQNPDDADAQAIAAAAEAEYEKSKAAADALSTTPVDIAAKESLST